MTTGFWCSLSTPYSHISTSTDFIYSLTAHSPYIQTLPYTHIPAVGPTPNALTSSLSPPLASSPPPASLRLKWSQESNTATMSGAAGEKRSEMERERERQKRGRKSRRKARTLHSLHSFQPHTRKWVSDSTQKSLFIRPLSPPCFSCLPFSALLSFSPSPAFLPSSSPYNFPSFFPLLSLKEGYFSANDLIRGAIWNSITADFIVATAIWIEGQRDGGRDVRAHFNSIFYDLSMVSTFFSFFFFFNTNNNNFISVPCFVQTGLLKCFTEED